MQGYFIEEGMSGAALLARLAASEARVNISIH